MAEAKALLIPANPNITLESDEESKIADLEIPNREAVGSSIFLSMFSHPDISFAVNVISQYLDKFKYSAYKQWERSHIDTLF